MLPWWPKYRSHGPTTWAGPDSDSSSWRPPRAPISNNGCKRTAAARLPVRATETCLTVRVFALVLPDDGSLHLSALTSFAPENRLSQDLPHARPGQLLIRSF